MPRNVPLKSISVEVLVQDHVATVFSTLQYVNEEERPLEALFVLPLPADAAVCHFSAKIGEQEIVAEVQDRETARDQYDDAVSSGQQAFLLEESAESPDVFRLSVGCLSAGQNAAVTIIYVTELAVQADHSLRFCLPAVLNPRYTPAGSAAGIVSEISSGAVPYTLTLSVYVSSPKPISKLESNCTLDPLVFLHSDHTQATVDLSPGHMFDKDIELFVYYQDTHQPSAIVEAGVTTAPPGSLMRDPVVMISLYPEFPEEVESLATQGEFVFVIDRSGSMDCMMNHGRGAQKRIESAKDTLLLLLKSLPVGCYFNIYGFGSDFESFFTQSVEYNQDTMDQALKRVKEMRADMGGTEILQPLKHIYSQPCYPDHPRQLFVFTDGEVGNTKAVLDLVKSHAHSHRCFSFGIGEGASAALITGMAREGSGHAQFITDSDRMQPKVMQSLRFALQPALVNISVDWILPDGVTVDTLSPPISVLFQGQRALIYAQLKGESSGGSEGTVTVKYSLKDQPVTNQLHFCLKPTEETGLSIHQLAARTLIRSLEQEERSGAAGVEGIRSRMVELSVQAGVSSVHTAFIAVNKDSRQTVKGPLLQRRVPTYAAQTPWKPDPQTPWKPVNKINKQQLLLQVTAAERTRERERETASKRERDRERERQRRSVLLIYDRRPSFTTSHAKGLCFTARGFAEMPPRQAKPEGKQRASLHHPDSSPSTHSWGDHAVFGQIPSSQPSPRTLLLSPQMKYFSSWFLSKKRPAAGIWTPHWLMCLGRRRMS
ncbi:von Willebrand factor A domain-containing protein 5A-like isoform X3 [Onychostoma macrolepis]|uniref:von Willebrand factor A domain-containing protein 5A-like isoform X3 n=1 Tax=Onychostoma macrolepis TaxID=369639 RepID=UPI00272A4E8A|nr:von Willebrand factor A domain-containing protein 5A-like isoform X3 [Onychostoma macrolepis]